jgi:ParB family chromosome partitioning protein
MEEQELFYTSELPKFISDAPMDIWDGKAEAIVKFVDIKDICPDPENPPKSYKTEELARLAMDILENGLQNPIVLLSLKTPQKEFFRIISGEKRFRACLLARMEQIPCTVIYQKDVQTPVSVPPRNYFEKAKFYAEAINRGLYDEEIIAKNAGTGVEDVHSALLLLVFSQEEQDLLIKSGVPEQSARKLAKMDSNTRKGFLETIAHGTNVAAVCAKINEASAEDAAYSDKRFQRTKFCIRGNGFFLNSINHAVETMREGGVKVDFITKETDTDTVLTLTIPKVPEGM